MAEHRLWTDGEGRFFVGEYGTTEITADEASAYLHSSAVRARLDGPPRNVVVHPALPWRQLAVCLLVAALIGFWLAVGHS